MRLLLYPKRQSTEEERMEPFELNLWPDGPTYTFKPGGEEIWSDDFVMPREGVVNRVVQYVNEPTLKVFPAPTDRATGAAAIVAPGGGYSLLAMDKEGYDVAAWLNTMGVTAAVLKYRVRPNPSGAWGCTCPQLYGAPSSATGSVPCARFALALQSGASTRSASACSDFRRGVT
jgi:hypothetical protein